MPFDAETESEYALDGPSGLGSANSPREEVLGSEFENGMVDVDEPASLGDRLRAVLHRSSRQMPNEIEQDEEAGVAL